MTPNLVFSSPTAVPAVSKSVGRFFARSRVISCISCNAVPVAPVFCVTTFSPFCTSLKAFVAAAPTAMIGAVTYFVIPEPIDCILDPTCLNSSPRACIFALPIFFSSDSKCFALLSVSMISR